MWLLDIQTQNKRPNNRNYSREAAKIPNNRSYCLALFCFLFSVLNVKYKSWLSQHKNFLKNRRLGCLRLSTIPTRLQQCIRCQEMALFAILCESISLSFKRRSEYFNRVLLFSDRKKKRFQFSIFSVLLQISALKRMIGCCSVCKMVTVFPTKFSLLNCRKEKRNVKLIQNDFAEFIKKTAREHENVQLWKKIFS